MKWNSVRRGQKYFVRGWLEQPRRAKKLLYRYDDYSEPTKEGPLSYVLLESPFASVSTASRVRPSLVSLGTKLNAKRKYTIQNTIQISTLQDSVVTIWRPPFQGFLWFSANWENTQEEVKKHEILPSWLIKDPNYFFLFFIFKGSVKWKKRGGVSGINRWA